MINLIIYQQIFMFQGLRRKSTERNSTSRQNSHKKINYLGFFTQDEPLKKNLIGQSHSRERFKVRKSSQSRKQSLPPSQKLKKLNQPNSLQKKQKLLGDNNNKIIKYTNIDFNHNNKKESTALKWRQRPIIKNSSNRKYEKCSEWNPNQAPYSSDELIAKFGGLLTLYEKEQVYQFKKIYFIGSKVSLAKRIEQEQKNFRNEEKQYLWIKHDQIGYRYQILDFLGKGSYGEVLKVFDHQTKQQCALKIIKCKSKLNKQALIQYKILSYIKEKDKDQSSNLVKVKDFLVFRKHICIVFELLSDNLYQLLARNNYEGLPDDLIRRIAIQLFTSLDFMKRHKIIHCDLKPQNVLLKEPLKSGIKIVDFGSSCFVDETIYTYIQSRFYRAPQIFLGFPYDSRIDIWSVGCILAELYLGVPLFPGNNEFQQVKFIVKSLGTPPPSILQQGTRVKIFFNSDGNMNQKVKDAVLLEGFDGTLKQKVKDLDFVDLILSLLKWDPRQRVTPDQALKSKWIVNGLPKQFKDADLLNRRQMSQIIVKKKSKSKDKNHFQNPKKNILK